ncbi:MAG: hydroxymethylbilane synthase [bacterium]
MRRLVLATRGSALALAQARSVAGALKSRHSDLDVELRTVHSEGDQRVDLPLSQSGGQGLFTRVLEEALLKGEADCAVHSLKDLPTQLPEGLALAAIGKREDWHDAWLSRDHASALALPQGAVVGTGSPRRRTQLSRLRPDLRYVELRGNVDTRLRKIDQGDVDGAVLALAGLKRLGLEAHVRSIFDGNELLPAPGQGFVAVETRDSGEAYTLCRDAFNHAESEIEAVCERAFLARLRAGCMSPVGTLAKLEGASLSLHVFVALNPERPMRREAFGPGRGGRALAEGLADALLAGGL